MRLVDKEACIRLPRDLVPFPPLFHAAGPVNNANVDPRHPVGTDRPELPFSATTGGNITPSVRISEGCLSIANITYEGGKDANLPLTEEVSSCFRRLKGKLRIFSSTVFLPTVQHRYSRCSRPVTGSRYPFKPRIVQHESLSRYQSDLLHLLWHIPSFKSLRRSPSAITYPTGP